MFRTEGFRWRFFFLCQRLFYETAWTDAQLSFSCKTTYLAIWYIRSVCCLEKGAVQTIFSSIARYGLREILTRPFTYCRPSAAFVVAFAPLSSLTFQGFALQLSLWNLICTYLPKAHVTCSRPVGSKTTRCWKWEKCKFVVWKMKKNKHSQTHTFSRATFLLHSYQRPSFPNLMKAPTGHAFWTVAIRVDTISDLISRSSSAAAYFGR